MKRLNVLAASLIAATFVSLSLLLLTRDALLFDTQLATGKPILGSTLTDLGLKQSDMPLGGIGPMLAATSDQLQARSPKFYLLSQIP